MELLVQRKNPYGNDIAEIFISRPSSGISLKSGRVVHIPLYADDMILIAPDKISLKWKLNKTAEFLDNNQLTLNLDKTKVVVFRKSGRIWKDDTFYWNRCRIEVVKHYVYFGICFDSSLTFKGAKEYI